MSGFYTRQRQGEPRRSIPWTPREATVFQRFATPNELALGLNSDDAEERAAAEAAMAAIRHLWSYWRWFDDEDYLIRRSSALLMILFQERLDADFAILTEKLGVVASLPTDDVLAHRNPSVDTHLSTEAFESLHHWYRRDYQFLALCEDLRSG